MGFEEALPRRQPFPIRRRFDAVDLQNIAVLSTSTSWTLGNELPLPGNPGNSLIRPAAKGRPGWRSRRGFVEDCDGPVRFPLNPIREG